MYDCIVVGGGIVGTSTAYHLEREGVETLLVDREDDGRATTAGAGIISPPTASHDQPDAWFEFGADAATYYEELDARIRDEGGGETGYVPCDIFSVAVDEDELDPLESKLEALRDRQRRLGTPAEGSFEEVSPATVRAEHPAVGDVRRAFRYTDAARLDGELFTRAMRRAAAEHDLQVERADAESIRVEDGVVEGVVADGRTYEATNVVVAGGAWSPAFESQLGVDIPVEPKRGQIAHLDVDEESADWPIVRSFHGHYVVPWRDGRVAVGATREAGTGFDPRLTAGGVHEILDEALRVAPGLSDATLAELRVGLRPISPDRMPVLGTVPGVEGAFLATGHGAAGLMLGPYSGKVVAEVVRGASPSSDVAPFAVDRFQ